MRKENGATYTSDELKRMRRASYIKMAAMVGFVIAILAFSSLAWFTMNREVEGSGVQMKSSGENFQITSLTGENLSAGLWYDPYHKKIMGDDSGNSAEIPSGVWMMTSEANFGNYSYDSEGIAGIKPGSYGKVAFNITPLIDTLDLQFTFDVVGYHSSDSVFNEQNSNSENQPLTLTPLTDMGTKKAEIAEYLNGHILLFENRTPVYEKVKVTDPETGTESEVSTNKILSYTYSGLIKTNEDMQRVLKNTEKTHFTGKDTATPVEIYWVWPNTLSTLVNVGNKDEVKPFCTGEDLAEVTAYVLEHPQYFLKGYDVTTSGEADDSSGDGNAAEEGGDDAENSAGGEGANNEEENNAGSNEGGNTSSSTLTVDDIINDYVVYSDMYDMADNDIGMNVSYVLLKLTATENTNSGSAASGNADPENQEPENPDP